jgi:hypothetical protein
MATLTITIPDGLITLYNEARTAWNPSISTEGGNLMPPPTKAALEKLLKDYIKAKVLGNAVRVGKTDDEVDALRALLDGF